VATTDCNTQYAIRNTHTRQYAIRTLGNTHTRLQPNKMGAYSLQEKRPVCCKSQTRGKQLVTLRQELFGGLVSVVGVAMERGVVVNKRRHQPLE